MCAKYESLVHRLEAVTNEQMGVFQLGWWALRTSASALALVRRDNIYLCNNRWRQIEREGSDTHAWEPLVGGTSRTAAISHPSLRQLALAEARSLLVRGRDHSRVARYRRVGDSKVYEVRSELLTAPRAVALLIHDVTAELAAESELRASREALHERHRLQSIGEVASGVAHDLNNALNVMRLRLALIQKRPADESQAARLESLSHIIDDAATRIARLQDLSRKQAEETFDQVDLRQVIDESVALAGTQLEQLSLDGKQFRVLTDIPDRFQVRGNSAELKHLFVNLLFNARDAMPEGGTISIQARGTDDGVVVTVADEGVGIPSADLERIFESFYTTKGKEGTGLGLSMARGAMARIGGAITARNRVPRGAEFVLRFPRQAKPGATPSVHPAGSIGPLDRELHVLLVDDDLDCLSVTGEVLEEEGVTVTAAKSGAEAVTRLDEHAYDLLLCDIGMPGMSGWEVAREARIRQPGLPIYMVTGWASEFAAEDARRTTVDGVLGKPLDIDELRRVLAQAAAVPGVSRHPAAAPAG
ncbi:MAG TPA: response regulator [Myxococcales bacterium]|nr:response regulator [Myxococcales bacterium]